MGNTIVRNCVPSVDDVNEYMVHPKEEMITLQIENVYPHFKFLAYVCIKDIIKNDRSDLLELIYVTRYKSYISNSISNNMDELLDYTIKYRSYKCLKLILDKCNMDYRLEDLILTGSTSRCNKYTCHIEVLKLLMYKKLYHEAIDWYIKHKCDKSFLGFFLNTEERIKVLSSKYSLLEKDEQETIDSIIGNNVLNPICRRILLSCTKKDILSIYNVRPNLTLIMELGDETGYYLLSEVNDSYAHEIINTHQYNEIIKSLNNVSSTDLKHNGISEYTVTELIRNNHYHIVSNIDIESNILRSSWKNVCSHQIILSIELLDFIDSRIDLISDIGDIIYSSICGNYWLLNWLIHKKIITWKDIIEYYMDEKSSLGSLSITHDMIFNIKKRLSPASNDKWERIISLYEYSLYSQYPIRPYNSYSIRLSDLFKSNTFKSSDIENLKPILNDLSISLDSKIFDSYWKSMDSPRTKIDEIERVLYMVPFIKSIDRWNSSKNIYKIEFRTQLYLAMIEPLLK